ncbi:MAG: hypothetical protein HY698_16740 [Deltaproteobacteria bacterium]|nr:hypothetical protein [Deltaproteobacteria bacterium]
MRPETKSGAQSKTRCACLGVLGIALLVGYLVRMSTIDDVFATPVPHAYSEDDHYHLRRVMFGLRNDPLMLERDPFMSYPHGAWSWWPDGFDRLLINAARGLVGPSATMPELVGALSLITPLLSLLALPLVFLLGARLMGWKAGAASALVLALLPAHAYAGMAGLIDHHCIETVLSLAPLLFVGGALDAAGPRAVLWGMAGGAVMGGSLYFWAGVPLIWVALYGSMALATIGWPRAAWKRTAPALLAMVLAHVATAALAVSTTPLGRASEMSTIMVSRFHLVAAACLGAMLLLWGAAGWWARTPGRHLAVMGGAGAALLAVGAAARGVSPSRLAETTAFLRSTGIVAWISETAPLWRSFQGAMGHLTPVFFVLPLVHAWHAGRAFRGRAEQAFPVMAHAAGACFLALTALQFRHKTHWAPFVAVLIVGVVQELYCRAREHPAWRGTSLPKAVPLGLGLAVVITMYMPLTMLRDVTLDVSGREELLEACDWLRENTPPAGEPYRPSEQPTYSVLGAWDTGKTISSTCERPSIGSADALGEQLAGVLDVMRFFTTTDEDVARDILDRYHVRYLILPQQLQAHWEASVAMLGLDRQEFFTERGPASMYQRLYRFDGAAMQSGALRLPAIRDVRLIYEAGKGSPEQGAPIVKVLERTRGVFLTARLAPSEPAILEAIVVTNKGRTVTYQDYSQADESGQVRWQFPYTERTGNGTGLVSPVRVRTPSSLFHARVEGPLVGQEIPLLKSHD